MDTTTAQAIVWLLLAFIFVGEVIMGVHLKHEADKLKVRKV